MSTAEAVVRHTRLPGELEDLLVCPRCKSRLEVDALECRCSHLGCGQRYPIQDRVAVLFNESNSLFTIAGVLDGIDKPFVAPVGKLRRALSRYAPTLSGNISGRRCYGLFARQLLDRSQNPRVLVVGSRTQGSGMEVLGDYPQVQVIESDVELGKRPVVLFDVHDIPFEDETFDGVVAQAVLEHVVDPARAVSEFRRVLKPGGIVYAETPFMQQVHEGAYDYTRFTHLGHRRLFRDFEEIDSGIAGGPGMALAWAWQYFLMSFARTSKSRTLAKAAARLTAFPLKYFDRLLASRPAAYDAASGLYFIGRRSTTRMADRQLVQQYRGAIR